MIKTNLEILLDSMIDTRVISGRGNSSWRLAATFRQVPVLIESPEVSIMANYHLSTLTACRLKISQLDNWTQPLGNLLTTDWLAGTLELKVFWYPYLFLGYGFSEILIIKLKPVWICFHTNFYFIVSFYSVFTIVSLLAHMRFERSP